MTKNNFKGQGGLADLRKFIKLSSIKYGKNCNYAEVEVMPNCSIKVFP
jgi:hypothetical protein